MSFARLLPRSLLLISLSIGSLVSWADVPVSPLLSQPNALPESSPEAQGVPSSAILKLTNSLDQNGAHSFVLLRHGKKIAGAWWAPYRETQPHQLWSVSKSFTSAAMGFAVAEKRLSIDDKVISFFPDDLPAVPSKQLRELRVRDLLTMTTGHEQDTYNAMYAATDTTMVKAFFAQPIVHKPGTAFIYNTGATYMLSAIIQKLTGQTVEAYLTPRLFEPLGISQHGWHQSRDGVSYGGFGLHLTTDDLAKFGQLYLNNGSWNGQQLLPAEWIAKSTTKQVSNGSDPASFWDQGYGFQFWRNLDYGYRADGAFGQYCFVLPEFDLVLAATSGTGDMGSYMARIWRELIPNLQAEALSPAPADLAKLQARLAHLSLPVTAGKRSSPVAKTWSGKRVEFAPNIFGLTEASLEFGKDSNRITLVKGDLTKGGISSTLESGYLHWIDSLFAFNPYLETETIGASSSSAWVVRDKFVVQIANRQNQHMLTLNFHFTKDEVTIDGERNVDFGERKIPPITGKILP